MHLSSLFNNTTFVERDRFYAAPFFFRDQQPLFCDKSKFPPSPSGESLLSRCVACSWPLHSYSQAFLFITRCETPPYVTPSPPNESRANARLPCEAGRPPFF